MATFSGIIKEIPFGYNGIDLAPTNRVSIYLTDDMSAEFAQSYCYITNRYRERINATISRCIDGDTIEVIMDGESQVVRLIGVDCPETKEVVEPWGPEASNFRPASYLGALK